MADDRLDMGRGVEALLPAACCRCRCLLVLPYLLRASLLFAFPFVHPTRSFRSLLIDWLSLMEREGEREMDAASDCL